LTIWTPRRGLFEPRSITHYLRWPLPRRGQRSGKKRQRVFDVGEGIADEPQGMQYFSKCEADESSPGANDHAKSNRVGVDGASPAAARGRTRPDIVPDRPERDQAQNSEYGCDKGRRHGEAQIVLRFQHRLIKKFCRTGVPALTCSLAPCETPKSSLSCIQRRRRCFIAPALGRPLNSSAAPDVRAPVVRGRWHFGASSGPFDDLSHVLPTAVLDPRLGFPGGCGYTLAA
jgi:hypothetical protein